MLRTLTVAAKSTLRALAPTPRYKLEYTGTYTVVPSVAAGAPADAGRLGDGLGEGNGYGSRYRLSRRGVLKQPDNTQATLAISHREGEQFGPAPLDRLSWLLR